MKKHLLIAILATAIIGCSPETSSNETENEFAKTTGFDKEILSDLNNIGGDSIQQLPTIDQETGEMNTDSLFPGFYYSTTEEKAYTFVKTHKSNYRKKGYLVFMHGNGVSMYNVAVIKGTEEFDILKYRRTDGINHGLETEDIIKRALEWKSKYGVSIMGCGRDWVHMEFDKLPSDISAFADEVYAFCPDSVDQGVGSIEELRKAILQMRGVWLWWD